jgi:hypothetical protein
MLVTAPLLTVCPMPRLYPGGHTQPRQAKLVAPDAYLAALGIESGSEWITTDRDFSRFPGLRWRHPLDA